MKTASEIERSLYISGNPIALSALKHVHRLDDNLCDAEAELDTANIRIAELEADLAAADRRIAELETSESDLEADLEAAELRIVELEGAVK